SQNVVQCSDPIHARPNSAIEITTPAACSPRFASSITMASPEISARGVRVACPYFMPVEKMENGSWPHPSRLPLGCGWKGYCTAPGHEPPIPAQDVLEAFCNLGYASSCGWAPTQRAWDSVRFAVSAPPGQDAHRKFAVTSDE